MDRDCAEQGTPESIGSTSRLIARRHDHSDASDARLRAGAGGRRSHAAARGRVCQKVKASSNVS